jgi:hypothetical protein
LLSWDTDDWKEFFNKYLELSDDNKKQILGMFVPDLNMKIMNQAMLLVMILHDSYEQFTDLGPENIKKLIGIAMANCYTYRSKNKR